MDKPFNILLYMKERERKLSVTIIIVRILWSGNCLVNLTKEADWIIVGGLFNHF